MSASRTTAGQPRVPPSDGAEPQWRGGSALSQMGRYHPHGAAINIAQENTRMDHPMMTMQLPEPNEWSGRTDEASATLQNMLRSNGYPEEKAKGAWVAQRKQSDTASAIGYDPDERTVGVGLHPSRWDYGTMAHEAAHLIVNHQKGYHPAAMAKTLGLGDHDVHGHEFARAYEGVIRNSWGQEAGDDFRRHHEDAVTLVSNYPARIHKLPRIDQRREAGRHDYGIEQHGRPVEWVSVHALMPHREWHHGPGRSTAPDGTLYAPRHSPESWAANSKDVAEHGIRESVHVSWDPKANTAYVSEGNSRLTWAAEAGHEAVPATGHRVTWAPDGPQYQLSGPSRGDEIRERRGGHIPADLRPSEFLPASYMHQSAEPKPAGRQLPPVTASGPVTWREAAMPIATAATRNPREYSEDMHTDFVARHYWDPSVPKEAFRQAERPYLDHLKGLVTRDGMTSPIEVKRHGESGKTYIDDGLHRLLVAEELGMKSVPLTFATPDGYERPSTWHAREMMAGMRGGKTAASGDDPDHEHRERVYGAERRLNLSPDTSAREERGNRWHEFRNGCSPDVHRGIVVVLPEGLHAIVHDETIPRDYRARTLAGHFANGLGMHWTSHVDIADRATHNATDGHAYLDEDLDGAWDDESGEPEDSAERTHVMFHARKPAQRSILRNRDQLEAHRVGWNYSRDEDEVAVKPGSPVFLNGISWKLHEPEYPNEAYEHEDFEKPLRCSSSQAEPERDWEAG